MPHCLGPTNTPASSRFIANQLRRLHSATQRLHYADLMTGRSLTKTNVSEAVEVVLLEGPLSGCCARCEADEADRLSAEEIAS